MKNDGRNQVKLKRKNFVFSFSSLYLFLFSQKKRKRRVNTRSDSFRNMIHFVYIKVDASLFDLI